MTNLLQTAPYLRNQRQFPNDNVKELSNQVDQAYIDIASKVNRRIIGNYPVNFQAVTGERWYFSGSNSSQQSLRQVYEFTAVGSVPHGLTWASVSSISPRSYGTFTDGTNWYGCIYGNAIAVPLGQVTFYVTPTNIVIAANVSAPTIVSGYINLEIVSQS
jgi:hypothetical protein